MVVVSNRVSLGSLGAALSLAPFVWWMKASVPFTILGMIISVFVFIRHKENIQRLLAGTESKFREKNSIMSHLKQKIHIYVNTPARIKWDSIKISSRTPGRIYPFSWITRVTSIKTGQMMRKNPRCGIN